MPAQRDYIAAWYHSPLTCYLLLIRFDFYLGIAKNLNSDLVMEV